MNNLVYNNFTVNIASVADVQMLKELWHNTFGDSYDYIDFFMREKFKNCIVLTAKQNHVLTGALYLMPVVAEEYGKAKNGYYLYALSVDERHRNLGIGSGLVKAACDLADESCAFIALCPSEESLVSYYRKLGFCENAYVSELVFHPEKKPINLNLCELNLKTFEKLRNESFENMIIWDKDALEFILKENTFLGGKNICFSHKGKECFLLMRRINNEAVVLESNLGDDEKRKISGFLAHKFNLSAIKWIVPHNPDINSVLYAMTYKLANNDLYFNHILN